MTITDLADLTDKFGLLGKNKSVLLDRKQHIHHFTSITMFS